MMGTKAMLKQLRPLLHKHRASALWAIGFVQVSMHARTCTAATSIMMDHLKQLRALFYGHRVTALQKIHFVQVSVHYLHSTSRH